MILRSLRASLKYLPQRYRLRLPLMLLAIIGLALLDLMSLAAILPVLLVVIRPEQVSGQEWLQRLQERLGTESHQELTLWLLGGLLLLFFLKNILAWRVTAWQYRYLRNLSTDLGDLVYRHFLSTQFLDLQGRHSARDLQKLITIPRAFVEGVLLGLIKLASELLIAGVILFALALYQPMILLLLFVVLGPGVWLIYRLRRRYLARLSDDSLHFQPLFIQKAIEGIRAWTEIMATQKEGFFRSRFHEHNARVDRIFEGMHLSTATAPRMVEMIAVAGICLVLGVAVFGQAQNESLMLMLGLFVTAAYRLIPSFNRILTNWMQIRSRQYTIDELEDLGLDSQTDVVADAPGEGSAFAAPISIEKLELKDIAFAYPGGKSCLDGLHLSLSKGEKLGIIGESGAGKTTLVRLLLRLLDADSGSLLLNGQPWPQEEKARWRQLFAYVPQSPFLLDASLAQNIAFGIPDAEIDRSRVEALVDRVQLRRLVEQWPQGIDQPIGEEGGLLSGGQRQRIALARALYEQKPVLLLDEVTSNLDQETEQEVVQTLTRLTEDLGTMLIVSHRPAILQGCDRVLRLERGRLVEV